MKLKIKAHIDALQDDYTLFEKILDSLPYEYDDDVYEFEIEIKNIKNITDEIGEDEDGCRAFNDVEITEIKES